MNNLQLVINQNQIFHSDLFGDLTILTDQSNNVWFIASEIASILDYSETSVMLRRIDNEDILKIAPTFIVGTNSMAREITIIRESGLYTAILGSKKSDAKTFKRWITNSILPSIRKTGSYTLGLQQLPNFSNPAEAAYAWADQYTLAQSAIKAKAEIGSRREATAMNTASQAVKTANKLKIELDKHNQWATILRVQKITGIKYNWVDLKDYSLAHNLEIKKVDSGAQRFASVNSYHAEAWYNCYDVDILKMVP